MAGWTEFSRAMTSLNAREAFAVASAIEKHVYPLHYRTFPFRRDPVQDLPDLLVNYACAQGGVEMVRSFDAGKVASAANAVLGTNLKAANGYTLKLGARIEFQPSRIIDGMPTDANGIYDLAVDDAANGDRRGFAWGCFRLKQAFGNPSLGLLPLSEALDLHDGLRDVPDVVVDAYGEAGLDIAMQMEKLHRQIGVMPVYPM